MLNLSINPPTIPTSLPFMLLMQQWYYELFRESARNYKIMINFKDYKNKIFLEQYPRPAILSNTDKTTAVHFLLKLLKARNNRFIGESPNLRLSLRTQMVICLPSDFHSEFWKAQDSLLWTETSERGIVDCNSFYYRDNIALWQGDITQLNADAIVNAANKEMLGCFAPDHRCIDNVIHAAGGLQIRRDCDTIMKLQNCLEPTGSAKITSAYNLPAKYILHTVGPIIYSDVTAKDEQSLMDCYLSCLNLAKGMKLKTVAFCCISTGVFRYPNDIACTTAIKAVRNWLNKNSGIKVIFNVFLDKDKTIYERELRITAQGC